MSVCSGWLGLYTCAYHMVAVHVDTLKVNVHMYERVRMHVNVVG